MDAAHLSVLSSAYQSGRDIPFVDLRRQYDYLKSDVLQAVEASLESMRLNGGPSVPAFEDEFAYFAGADHAVAVGSGTEALVLALRALGLGAGDEVITVSHTFAATAAAIRIVGATPVFVDIDPVSYTIDVRQMEAAITPQTRAVLPVHLYGQMAAMPHLVAVAKRHGLLVIEDACQAHGAWLFGDPAGTVGDAAAFSFYCSKNLGAYGEAGMVTTMRTDVARKVRLLRDHGSEVRYHHDLVGTNARMDEIQAAILRVKLHHLAVWNRCRVAIARQYEERLRDIECIELPQTVLGATHVFHLYVALAPDRDELRRALAEEEIASGVHYPIPVHKQRAFAGVGRQLGDLPETNRIAANAISLPMFPELRTDEVDRICGTIRKHYGKPAL